MRKVIVAGGFAAALLLSACASSTTPTITTAPTINLAGIQQALKAIQPGIDAAASAVLADNSVSFQTKTRVNAAQQAFDAAVTAFVNAPATANNIPALANAVASAANAVVPTLPLTAQQKTDVSLALGLVETVGTIVINATAPTASATGATAPAASTASSGGLLSIF